MTVPSRSGSTLLIGVVDHMVAQTQTLLGPIDFLVNNADSAVPCLIPSTAGKPPAEAVRR